MAVFLNFNLPQLANTIDQVICLYDPAPVFQFEQNTDFTYSILSGDKYRRDSNVASAGFPASIDPGPVVSGQQIGSTATTFPIPANSYAKDIPSQVYGTPTDKDNYTVLMINASLARIEPGFSRLRIDYTVYNSINNTYTPQTFYSDCPFYEGWDVTARELNNVVSYVEGGIGFLQTEIAVLQQEVSYALSREFWRGTSVSGQISSSGQITQGLQTNQAAVSAHNLPISEFSPLEAKPMSALEPKLSGGGYGPIRDIDVNAIIAAYNYPGRTANGNWILKNCDGPTGSGAGPQPGNIPHTSCLLSENDDGSLTFWLYSDHFEDTSLQATGIAQAIITASGAGGVTSDANRNGTTSGPVGAFISFFGFNGYSNSGPQLTDNFGNNSNPQAYYHNSKQLYANSTTSSGAIGTNSFPAITTGVFDSVLANISSGNSKKLYRALLKPTLAPGGILQFADSYHITHGGGNPGDRNSSYTDLGALYSQGSSDGRSLILKGSSIVNSTPIINAMPNGTFFSVLCVGKSYGFNGTNLTTGYTLYIGGLGHPQLNLSIASSTVGSFTVADGTPIGSQIAQLISNTDVSKKSSPFQVNVQGVPSLTACLPNSSKTGINVTLTGSGFGNYYPNFCSVQFAGQSANPSIVSWTDTQIIVTVPSLNSTPTYPFASQVSVQSFCSLSNVVTFNFTSDKSKTFNLSPSPLHVASNRTGQLQAVIYDPNANTTVDVSNTSTTIWNIFGGVYPGTDQGSGNSTYGTISQQGLYTAPASLPPGQDGTNGVSTIRVASKYTDSSGLYSSSSSIFIDLTASLVVSPNTVTISIPTSENFSATFTLNSVVSNVSLNAVWSVNGIQGGTTALGTIANGLYIPPPQAPAVNPLTISASYVFNSNRYQASAQLYVVSPPVTQMALTVTSQINVYLGDGRFGYIPVGTSIIVHLNDYVFVQFVEKLNSIYKFPVPSYQAVQQLPLVTRNASDSSIGSVLYDTANRQIQPDGTTLTTRTVVLGIIDPSDGFFHSLWDIGQAPVLASSQAHGMNLTIENANQLKAFPIDHHFKGSILDYVDDLSNGAQTQLNSLYNKANIVLAGSAIFDNAKKVLFITKPLRILGISNDTYGILGIVPVQQIEVPENSYVYIDKNNELKVGKFSDYFTSLKTDVIIVGTVLDKFYTTWPLIDGLETDVSHVKSNGETSHMRVGPLIVQWGISNEYELLEKDSTITDRIVFPVAYSTSCAIMTEPIDSNGAYPAIQVNEQSLNNFDIKIVNQQNVKIKTKASWLSIGV